MGFGTKRGKMWAGVMDDHIVTDDDKSIDEYTPLTVALFKSKAAAKKRFRCVVEVDVDAMFCVAAPVR